MRIPASAVAVLLLPLSMCFNVRDVASKPMSSGAAALPPDIRLTLVLQPGIHSYVPPIYAFYELWKPAPDMPPGNVTINLPVYPGAIPATKRYNSPGFALSMDPYLKSGWAEKVIPVPAASAVTWYRGECAAIGLLESEHVSGSGTISTDTIDMYFISKPDPSIHGGFYGGGSGFSRMLVGISLQPADTPAQSAVYYWVEDSARPAGE